MTAVFSHETPPLYRYWLERNFLFGKRVVVAMLHNPSVADGCADDPTTTRLISFARSWGAGKLIIVNPWAGIATDKRDLWRLADPVGPHNDEHIIKAADAVKETDGVFLVGWGRVEPPPQHKRLAEARITSIREILRILGVAPCALSVNQDMSPKHPLYVKANALPVRWPQSWERAG